MAHVFPMVAQPLILGVDFWKTFCIAPEIFNSVEFVKPSTSIYTVNVEIDSRVSHYDSLTISEKVAADNIISQFRDISTEVRSLGRTHLVEHRIDTGDHASIRQRCYRLSPEKQKALSMEVDKMLELDIIEPCESPWLSPVLITPKKDGEWRFCIDSRKLNNITKKDAYKLPFISEILDSLRDAKYLSSVDICKAFWEVPLNNDDKIKTAFHVQGRGMFCFKVMPFGLTNAPATQQRLMDKLFTPDFENKVFYYLDDIVIISKTFDEHITILFKVLSKLKNANITINFNKSQFFRKELKYLGYVVDEQGLRTDPNKVEAILKISTPTSRKDVKKFLGTASWYRRFIPNFSNLATPLNKLTSSGKKVPPFKWTEEAEKAFIAIKKALVATPSLACPDFTKRFAVHCDASSFGMGAMLTQEFNDVEKPIAYMSKSFNSAQRNYSITERELLSVITALEHWRCYLDNGQRFTLYTDHSALQWFLKLDNPTGRLARWCVRLSAFNFDIKHKSGKDNVVPDILSRSIPIDLITYNSSHVTDEWYRDLFQRCSNSPNTCLNYIIKNNKLYRYCRTGSLLSSEYDWKEVIPADVREMLIMENHNTPTSAHFGIFKTYHKVKLRYFWPGMYRDVAKFISKCDTCMSYKNQNHLTLGIMGKPKHCSRPFQCISVDLLGPLPLSRKLNRFILVVTCCFSKYCLLFSIKRATASIVKHMLENLVFLKYGIPETIIMDNGPQFASDELTSMLNSYNIPRIQFLPRYCPQVNTVERYNKTIMTAIASFVGNDHRTWDLNIPKIEFAINSAVNEVTKYTPAFLVFGRELVPCGSVYVNTDNSEDLIFAPRDQFADNIGLLGPIFSEVQQKLWVAHDRSAKYYNLRRMDVSFNIGDVVWKKNYTLSNAGQYYCSKLAPKFTKCRIIRKISPLVYDLSDLNGKHLGRWHVKDLKVNVYTP